MRMWEISATAFIPGDIVHDVATNDSGRVVGVVQPVGGAEAPVVLFRGTGDQLLAAPENELRKV